MQSIADLRHYGYNEDEILSHTIEWLNYHLAFESERETQTLRLHETARLQAAMLTGVMFHDPEQGMELYSQLRAALGDEDDDSDTAWMRNAEATTNLADIERLNLRRIHERRSGTDAGNDAGGNDSDRSTDNGHPPDRDGPG